MKHVSRISFLLSVLFVLGGCGGGDKASSAASAAPQGTDPAAPALNATENWQFTTTSTRGFPSLTIAGGIDQTTSPVSGAVHVNGSLCFDHLKVVQLTGVLNGSNLSLTSAPVAGQIVTSTGSITEDPLTNTAKFTGTYSIHGGCADGDQGNMAGGVELTSMKGNWAGDLTGAAGNINRLTVTLTQGGATPDGTFAITGTASFESGTCFKSATISSGKFPSGSYMMGQTVAFEIQTDNGVIAFLGTADHGGLIEGNYTIASGTCDPKGTGYLSPWEY
ncbi:MAG: hypothetical protein ACRD3L_03865 [Terriglobales bacterium]